MYMDLNLLDLHKILEVEQFVGGGGLSRWHSRLPYYEPVCKDRLDFGRFGQTN